MTITVHHADCVAWLTEHAARIAAGEAEPFDSCVTDPPYHLTSIVRRFGGEGAAPAKDRDGTFQRAARGFMGKQWDGGDVAQRVETWRAVFDCLKPGAHLVAFAGTRTFHRMACAIEDAGFEIRDQLAWVYGTGFPKSHDVSKALDKLAGAEREVVGPHPFAGRAGAPGANSTFGAQSHAETITAPATEAAREWHGWGTALKPAWEPICLARKPLAEKSVAAQVLATGTGAINVDACRVGSESTARSSSAKMGYGGRGFEQARETGSDAGRFPANLVHDGSDEVLAGFPETGASPAQVTQGGQRSKGGIMNAAGGARGTVFQGYGEPAGGTAARFFYSAKAGPLDRIGTAHATVKPVDLMRWLVRLVTPAGGRILEPFAGSGTTGIAAMAEGMACTMIELEAEHVADIERKLAHLRGEGAARIIEHRRNRIAGKQDEVGPLFSAFQ